MQMVKNLVFVALGLSGMPALASCPQEAADLGRLIGQAYCDVTKEAFAGSVTIRPTRLSIGNRCSNGRLFNYRDVLFCRRSMANEVSRDRLCNRIYRSNNVLNFGGALGGRRTPVAVFNEFQQDCAAN